MKQLLMLTATLLSIGGALIAQDLHGSIAGKVVDPQDAVIPDQPNQPPGTLDQ